MILTNGRIYTMEPGHRVVDTLVIRDGRVAFSGRRADVNASSAEDVIDLEGRAVLPGLVDAHGHLTYLAPDPRWTPRTTSSMPQRPRRRDPGCRYGLTWRATMHRGADDYRPDAVPTRPVPELAHESGCTANDCEFL